MSLLLQITSAKIYKLNITTIYTKMKKETLALVFCVNLKGSLMLLKTFLIDGPKKVP